MTTDSIRQQYRKIIALLDRKELASALSQLDTFLQGINDWPLHEELDEIKTSYEYMLAYLKNGSEDPQRHSLHKQLLARAYRMSDRIRLLHFRQTETTLLAENLRTQQQLPPRPLQEQLLELELFHDTAPSLPSLSGAGLQELLTSAERHEQARRGLFYSTWASYFWTPADKENAQALLTSEKVASLDKQLFISALTLSLFDHFDPQKAELLLQTLLQTSSPDEDAALYARLLTGTALTAYFHARQFALYPSISALLDLLRDKPHFAASLATLQLQLLYSRESPKTEVRIKEEILPDFISRTKKQMDKFHLGDDAFWAEKLEKNPEWEDALKNSGMENMMEELQNMMAEGEDIFLSSFAQIKNYPFFRDLHAWLLPFSPTHPELLRFVQRQPEAGRKPALALIELVAGLDTMCDSDKYSFLMTLFHIPEAQRNGVLQSLSAGMEEIRKSEGESKNKFTTVSRHYVQDLYRFFNLYSRRQEFPNIFRTSLTLYDSPLLRDTLGEAATLLPYGEFFIRKELWNEAETVYRRLAQGEKGKTSAEIFQKLGFSLQQQEKYTEALAAYSQADLIKPGQPWTLKGQAYCARKLGNYAEALTYFQRLRTLSQGRPSLSLLMQTGTCLLLMERMDEAMNLFFEAEFLNEQSPRPWRNIAWCSFLSGKTDQAARYYDKLLSLPSPTREDFLNAAHTKWAQRHVPEAITLYTKALALYPDFDTFRTTVYKDRPHLIQAGIAEDDIPLMVDLLQSHLTRNP